MANIIMDIEKGIEVGAADLLKFLSKGEAVLATVTKASPAALAALGVILGAVSTAVAAASSAASAGGANITLDQATVADIKAVWPDIEAFFTQLGVKL